MTIERTEVVWMESRTDYAIDELAALSGLPVVVVDALIASGALPVVGPDTAVRLETECVALAQAAQRLREHFELDAEGLAVAVSLLRRVRVLEAQVSGLIARSSTER